MCNNKEEEVRQIEWRNPSNRHSQELVVIWRR